jgi:hypothetical protein
MLEHGSIYAGISSNNVNVVEEKTAALLDPCTENYKQEEPINVLKSKGKP